MGTATYPEIVPGTNKYMTPPESTPSAPSVLSILLHLLLRQLSRVSIFGPQTSVTSKLTMWSQLSGLHTGEEQYNDINEFNLGVAMPNLLIYYDVNVW